MQTTIMGASNSSSNNIIQKQVKLPAGQEQLAFVLYNVLTKEECDDLISVTEEMGYEQAQLNIGGGLQILATDVRKSGRCIWDSSEKAEWLWNRIKGYIPKYWKGRKVIGLNERLRFLRYDPGEYFKPHMDGTYQRENGERSCITIHLYLNEGYGGGCTTFMDPRSNQKNDVPCQVKTGMVLVFEHRILHEGSLLEKGRKYTVRTDVMYSSEISSKSEQEADT